MFEQTLAKVLSNAVFWNRQLRRRFRANAHGWIIRAERVILHSSLTALPRAQGDRLVERRVAILGVPVLVWRRQRPKHRVALLVDEFFGGWDTAIGGYGSTARKYVCRFIPNDEIQIDLLLDVYSESGTQQKQVDQTMVYRLPRHPLERQRWLDRRAYNLFVSIEMTEPSFRIISEYKTAAPLLYWIRDPRDSELYQSRLRAVSRLRDYDWGYIKEVSAWIQEMMRWKRVSFYSQSESLSAIARNMYQIPDTLPIQELLNPIEMDLDYRLNHPAKENKIIFLGRLEAQKRVWIVCEIAKAMPQYEFYILGATGKGRNEAANSRTLEPYRHLDGSSKIKNLHFAGHVDGEIKAQHIKTAKLLLNTSIWEGLPVSWQEALSYGTLIVSAFDRDNIAGRFGTFVGEVMGDGTDDATIHKFTAAIEHWMTHESERNAAAQRAIEFVRGRHSVETFIQTMRAAILKNIP
jgi:glycosyltransferase involved in cell wall biosynthesis